MAVIKITNKSNNAIPEYVRPGDSGMDIRAYLKEPILIRPLERVLIPTGIYLEIPEGYEIQVRPRSGLALKEGLTVLNSPGTVDSNYTGEVGVILVNISSEVVKVCPNDRIAQLVCAKVEKVEFKVVENIVNNEIRGAEGYGSSGKQ